MTDEYGRLFDHNLINFLTKDFRIFLGKSSRAKS